MKKAMIATIKGEVKIKGEATMVVKPYLQYYFDSKSDFGFNQTKDHFKD